MRDRFAWALGQALGSTVTKQCTNCGEQVRSKVYAVPQNRAILAQLYANKLRSSAFVYSSGNHNKKKKKRLKNAVFVLTILGLHVTSQKS